MISPVLRPKLWSALLGAVAAAVLAAPAYAEPPLPNAIPDTGLRPTPAGALPLPGATPGYPAAGLPGASATPGAPAPSLVAGPLAIQINAIEAQVGLLGDQLLGLRQQRTEAEAQRATAERDLKAAEEALARAQARADTAAADAFKAAAALPPAEFAEDLHDLNMLQQFSRGEQAEGATTGAAGELNRTRAAREVAHQAWATADERARTTGNQFAAVQKALREQETKLAQVRRDNAAQLIEIERQQEAAEQRYGASYVAGQNANGLVASPIALAAVRYALAQIGDPYVWAAEGPNAFDCSGLVYAAYRSAGYYELPRVSRDQYKHTSSRTVDRSALLPGDLLFFASGSSWTTIHHMGMYIGGGKMVQAPTTGQTVKISTVGWSRLYAATRVVGAVPAPTTPAPTPPATTKPPVSPKPTTPTPKPTTPKPTTPGPRPTTPKPTTPTPTPTPTGTPTTPAPTSPPPTTPQPTSPPAGTPTISPEVTTSSLTSSGSAAADSSVNPSAGG